MWPSHFFTEAEMTRSQTAAAHHLNNTPPPAILLRLGETARRMDRIRILLSAPIHVNSGYRSPEVNRLVGSADSSAHVQGYAVDFTCAGWTPLAIAQAILARPTIEFDQIIHEGTWLHISFDTRFRRQVLTAHRHNGKTTYTEGLSA